jgi:sugar/nucleoside kinase (ribokinase family)
MYDIISIGDTTLDCFLTLSDSEADLRCELKKHTTEICFNYAGKIPVDGLDFSLGGNAANVAVGLKRQGFNAGLYSVCGEDEVGRIISEKIEMEGLSKEFIQMEAVRSSYSTIINYRKERTILEKRFPHHYQLPSNFPVAKFMYVSSLGPDYEEFFAKLANYVKEKGIKLGFNPAQPQLRSKFETYEALVKASHFIFVNKEEAIQLLSTTKQSVPKEVLGGEWGNTGFTWAMKAISTRGPRYVIITDGLNGAYCLDGEKYYHCEIFPVQAVEATGAGDAFASGFMGAIMHGKSTADAMRWGMVNSASVVTKIGAMAGLLSKIEIEERLLKRPGFGPREI